MDWVQKWQRQIERTALWQSNDRVLLAVSGGVDSNVLLDLFLHLPEKIRPHFGIAHVDHQLRAASKEERKWLESFCGQYGLPLYVAVWDEGSFVRSNLEERARAFRYDFFSTIMQQYDYQKLATAHHADDQAETVLMRLVKGAQLSALSGIKERRPFESGELIRPLLTLTKSELYAYAEERGLIYFEDESNHQTDYFRNQIRWQVLPILQKENPEISRQLGRFAQKMADASAIIFDQMARLADTVFNQKNSEDWILDLPSFQKKTTAEQYFLLVYWFERMKETLQLFVNEQQIEQILHILNQQAPQKAVRLDQHYQLIRRYDSAQIQRISDRTETLDFRDSYWIECNQMLQLSADQWMGVFGAEELKEVVEKQALEKARIVADLWVHPNQFPLTVRKRTAGDRLLLDEQHHKKISRLFIDQKLSEEERQRAWVLTTKEGEILWCLPYRRSYLSIQQETDKIHYRLVYWEKEEGAMYARKGH